MRSIAIVGLLCVATGSAAIATACSSFGDAEPALADAATSEAAASDAEPPSPDAPVSVDAAACVLATSPTLVAPTTSAPTRLGTNGASLFWIEGGTRIVRASVTDCSTTEVATGNISALAVDSEWVVWGDDTYKALRRSEVGTGVVPKTDGASIPGSLLLAGGTAFWIDAANQHVAECATPCTSTTVAAQLGSPTLLAANATRFFVFGVDADSGTAGALFWQALGVGPLIGPIFSASPEPVLLAANDLRVFWVASNGSVTGLPSGGGMPITFDTVSGAEALAVDSSFVYVATSTQIQRAPVAGGAWTPIVTGETAITSLLVTTDAVVWATPLAVRRIRKPT